MTQLKDSSGKPLRGEELKREMVRRSNDEFEVYNPTSEDFRVTYDSRIWIFPKHSKDIGFGRGINRVPRYIVLRYMDKMSVHQINKEYTKVIAAAKKKHPSGEWFGQKEIQIAPKTNDPVLRKKHIETFKIKLVRKFGLDEQTLSNERASKPKADVPMMELLLDELEQVEVSIEKPAVPANEDMGDMLKSIE